MVAEAAGPLCSVPLARLPEGTCFLMGGPGMRSIVGILERIPLGGGYATVSYYEEAKAKEHSFKDSTTGGWVEFRDNGLVRTDWAVGTLVRPIKEDDEMADEQTLVEAAPAAVSTDEIKAKVAKLHAKAAGKAVGKPAGKPAVGKGKAPAGKQVAKAKAPKEPKAVNPCRCGCGGTTGGTFCPGHDARYHGWLKKISAGEMEFKELPAHLRKEFVDVKGVKKALAASKH